MPSRQHIYFHSEDLDGWLGHSNYPILPVYRAAFTELQGLWCEADGSRHEVQIVLNSGKGTDYLEEQARAFGGEYVIGCSGAAWCRCGDATRPVFPPPEDFVRFRRLLGLDSGVAGVVQIRISGREAEIAVEEGKSIDERDLVLSLFPEAGPVAHRWRFRQSIGQMELLEAAARLIEEHRLRLGVLPPYPDGAVDVVAQAENRLLCKWTLPLIARRVFPEAILHLTHGGDGNGDVPAMEAPGVTPLSASNLPNTREVARRRDGVLAERCAPEGGAVLECYAELARRGFYGPLSERVAEVCSRHLAELA